MTLKEVNEMKKLLTIVAVVALTVGIGFGAKQVSDQAGNPPVGGFAEEQVVASTYTTFGNPPVGG
jgi:hypothetical protein